MEKFKIGDTVRVIGEDRIGEITEIGFSDRMRERVYIVNYKDSKRKVLEHQLETAPVVFSIKDFDAAAGKIEAFYADEVIPQLTGVDDKAGRIFMELVSRILTDVRLELTGGDDNAPAL